MRSGSDPFWRRQAPVLFGVCAVLYLALFQVTEWWRGRNGPWEVTFQTAPSGNPLVTVAAPGLAIRDVQLAFPGTNLPSLTRPVTVRFDGPTRREAPPFGRVVFLDTTILPGTVTLELFGHEVEFLPRTLVVDDREHPWRPGERLELPAR